MPGKNPDNWLLSREKKCPICGKLFYVPIQSPIAWAYKTFVRNEHHARTVLFCSWHCYREWQRKLEKKERKCLRCGKTLEEGSKELYCDICQDIVFIEGKRAEIQQEKNETRKTEKEAELQKLKSRKCLYCGKPIPMYERGNRKYCCPEHAHRAALDRTGEMLKQKRLQKKREELGERKCLYCGKPIPAEAKASQKYCCHLHGVKYGYILKKQKKIEEI